MREVSILGFLDAVTVEYRGHVSRGVQIIGTDPQIQTVNRYDPWYLDTALQFLSRVHDRYPFGDLTGETFPLSAVDAALARSADRTVARAMIVPDRA